MAAAIAVSTVFLALGAYSLLSFVRFPEITGDALVGYVKLPEPLFNYPLAISGFACWAISLMLINKFAGDIVTAIGWAGTIIVVIAVIYASNGRPRQGAGRRSLSRSP